MMKLAGVAGAASLVLTGCAGGSPLLHPARTLPTGEVRVAAGFSGNIAIGGLSDGLRAARDDAAKNPDVPGPPGSDPTYTKGALVAAAVAPGIAPFMGARVGAGDHFEGGLAYTGRGARIDLRRSFDSGAYSLSLGLGGTGLFYGHQDGSTLPTVDLGQLHGYGLDAPILGGWESTGGIYQLWIGARFGWEHVGVDIVRSEPKAVTLGTPPISLTADRLHAGGLVGLAIGFRHVHVALELDVAYQSVSGSYNKAEAHVDGVSLVPATAIWWKF